MQLPLFPRPPLEHAGDIRPGLSIFLHTTRLLTPAEFSEMPGPVVAIEAVDGPPGWSPNALVVDHHRGVPRPFCDCACKQVLVATDEGLWEHLFEGIGLAPVQVHLGRVDEDICLAVALLAHPILTSSAVVRRLVEVEDALDRSGGTSSRDATDEELGRIAWVNEPYHRVRAAGGVMAAEEGHGVLAAVMERIEAHAAGKSWSLPLSGEVEVVAREGPVAAVVEHGPYARLGLRRAGIDAYVAARLQGDRRIVTVGLTSAFVPLDLDAVYAELNELEGRTGGDGWGGGTHVGGSPFTGTRLAPEHVLEVMAKRFGAARGPEPRLSGKASARNPLDGRRSVCE